MCHCIYQKKRSEGKSPKTWLKNHARKTLSKLKKNVSYILLYLTRKFNNSRFKTSHLSQTYLISLEIWFHFINIIFLLMYRLAELLFLTLESNIVYMEIIMLLHKVKINRH